MLLNVETVGMEGIEWNRCNKGGAERRPPGCGPGIMRCGGAWVRAWKWLPSTAEKGRWTGGPCGGWNENDGTVVISTSSGDPSRESGDPGECGGSFSIGLEAGGGKYDGWRCIG
jgi:hypothetical protein